MRSVLFNYSLDVRIIVLINDEYTQASNFWIIRV